MNVLGYNIDIRKNKAQAQAKAATPRGFVGANFITEAFPQWVQMTEKAHFVTAYLSCPVLYSVVNQMSAMYARVKFVHEKVQSNGKAVEVENSSLIKLLNNPNVLQNRNEWLQQNYIQKKILGDSQIRPVSNSFTNTHDYKNLVSIWNLPSQKIGYKTTGIVYSATSINDIISEILFDGQPSGIDPNDIIILNDVNIKWDNGRYVGGSSRVEALNKPITNIESILGSRNVLINKRGAIGILSNDAKGDFGVADVDPTEKERLAKIYEENYGLKDNQQSVIFTSAALKWQQMAMPYKSMMFKEQTESDTIMICAGYDYPYEMYYDGGSSIFGKEKDSLEKGVYTKSIIPEWETLQTALNHWLGFSGTNERLRITYDHIEVLQKDKKTHYEVSGIKASNLLAIHEKYTDGKVSEQGAVNIAADFLDTTEDEARQILALEERKAVIEDNTQPIEQQ